MAARVKQFVFRSFRKYFVSNKLYHAINIERHLFQNILTLFPIPLDSFTTLSAKLSFVKPISPPPALGTYFDGISYEVISDEGISNDRNRYKQLQRSFILTAIDLLRKVAC